MPKNLPKKSRQLLSITFALALLFVLTCLTIAVVIVNRSQKQEKTEFNTTQTSAALSQQSISSTPVTISNTQNIPSPTATTQNIEKTIKIYFIKKSSDESEIAPTDFVQRKTTRDDVATFAIEQILAGPTNTEKTSGLSNPITLSGSSNCNKDFTLNISSGKAIIKFCRQINTAGIGDDARISTVINKTLVQFTNVQSVVILDKNDNCFGDGSGLDLCKQ